MFGKRAKPSHIDTYITAQGGATGGSPRERWVNFLKTKTGKTGSINHLEKQLLKGLGFSGTLSDMIRSWADSPDGLRNMLLNSNSQPISVTYSDTNGDTADASTYTTGSYIPTTSRLQLLFVYSIAATAPNTPTVTGNGMTWTLVDTQLDSGSVRKMSVFRAVSDTPTSGQLTINFGGQTQTGCGWSIVQLNNTVITNNGLDAIVQTVKGQTVGNATSQTLTVAALGNANNKVVAGFGIPLNTAGQPAVGAGYTLIGQKNQTSPNLALTTEIGTSTSVSANAGAASIPWAGIAIEIKHI